MYNVLTTIDSHHRLLLTGTPLQNSLKELWCLLSYLKLEVDNIETWEVFEASYGTAEERAAGYSKLHSLLKPYIIRRMKKVSSFFKKILFLQIISTFRLFTSNINLAL